MQAPEIGAADSAEKNSQHERSRRLIVCRESRTTETGAGGREKGKLCIQGLKSFPTPVPITAHYTILFHQVLIRTGSSRRFWFPVVGGVSGKGRMPMAALSKGTTCTQPFPPCLYPRCTDSARAFSLALPPLGHPIDLFSPCPGEAS